MNCVCTHPSSKPSTGITLYPSSMLTLFSEKKLPVWVRSPAAWPIYRYEAKFSSLAHYHTISRSWSLCFPEKKQCLVRHGLHINAIRLHTKNHLYCAISKKCTGRFNTRLTKEKILEDEHTAIKTMDTIITQQTTN